MPPSTSSCRSSSSTANHHHHNHNHNRISTCSTIESIHHNYHITSNKRSWCFLIYCILSLLLILPGSEGLQTMLRSTSTTAAVRGASLSSIRLLSPSIYFPSSSTFASTKSTTLRRYATSVTVLQSSPTDSQSVNTAIKKVVFLGTPQVAALSLQLLHEASKQANPLIPFEIASVVSQPPAPSGRKQKLTKSPVQEYAELHQLPVFVPETAKDDAFLTALEGMSVDLFVTAAYGNYLPKRFLSIAKYGTINIHPSLLPKYRGAAPVQRCLEQGDANTGVSVLYTVSKMDAGPILKQLPYPLLGSEKATKVLDDCFALGTKALIDVLPQVFTNQIQPQVQDDSQATHAAKIDVTEGYLNFLTMSARQIHNKCRAFAEWPGTSSNFYLAGNSNGLEAAQRVKIITTEVVSDTSTSSSGMKQEVKIEHVKQQGKDMLVVTCFDGSQLGIVELQLAGKKVMDVKSFMNGQRGVLHMTWAAPPSNEAAMP